MQSSIKLPSTPRWLRCRRKKWIWRASTLVWRRAMAKPMSAQAQGPTKEMRVHEELLEALRYEMARDERVFVMGEDVALFGGAYGVTRGLMQEFGEERVLDTPISEAGMIGLAVGAAINGMRPIVEIQFCDLLPLAMD